MTHTLPGRINDVLHRLTVPPSHVLLVACSGGGDSAVLAHALKSIDRHPLLIAHIDHGIRDSASCREECQVVDCLGSLLEIPVLRRTITPGMIARIAREEGRSIEEVAREHRYRLLEEIARETGADNPVTILTAHHGQDQLETVLMRILAGRSPLDPPGIPEERCLGETGIRIVRPLLAIPRFVLLEYQAEHNLPVMRDPSNSDTRFLRNNLRHTLIPAVHEIFEPREVTRVTARYVRDMDRLREAFSDLIPLGARGENLAGRWRVELSHFDALPSAAQEMVLRGVLYRYANTTRVPYQPFRLALESRCNTRAAGISLVWSDRYLEVSDDIVPIVRRGYLWLVDSDCDVRIGGDNSRPSVLRDGPGGAGRWMIGPLEAPVLIRPLRIGEKVFRRGKARRVREELKRDGMSRNERDDAPVLEDRDGFVTILNQKGPLCTRDGVEYTEATNTRREGYIILRVDYEDRNAERR